MSTKILLGISSVFALAQAVALGQLQLVLDSRSATINETNAHSSFGADFDPDLSGARSSASQTSSFTDTQISGIGTTSITVPGGLASSYLNLSFKVSSIVPYKFTGSCSKQDTATVSLHFQDPLNPGNDVSFVSNGSATTSGTFFPNQVYSIGAAVAGGSGSWQVKLDLGTPPTIVVTPNPVDFGNISPRNQEDVSFAIVNEGDPDTVLTGTVQQPSDSQFMVISSPLTFSLAGGEAVEMVLQLKVSDNPAQYERQLNATLPISSTDPNTPSLSVPLTAFVKGPEPINFRKLRVPCLDDLIPNADLLQAQLEWESSTGKRSDLQGVVITEELEPGYGWAPGSDPNCVGCLSAPPPFVFSVSPGWQPGPGIWHGDEQKFWSLCYSLPDETGAGLDQHGTKPREKPYCEAAFEEIQQYQWTAPWHTTPTVLLTDHIQRAVTGLSAGPVTIWRYSVKSDYAGEVDALFDVTWVRQISLTGSGSSRSVNLSFGGDPGNSYSVQRALSLGGPWTVLGTVTVATPSDGSWSFADTNPPPAAAFYRAQQQ